MKMICYLQNNAQLVSMTEGEVLFHENDELTGIFIIVSGLLKVSFFYISSILTVKIACDFRLYITDAICKLFVLGSRKDHGPHQAG